MKPMLHQTTEYKLALDKHRTNESRLIPTAWAILTGNHVVNALSIDGAIKSAANVAIDFRVTVIEFGHSSNVYRCSEQKAWQQEQIK